MLKPGDTFHRYTIEAVVGQGGMGCVYRAHDPRLDRRVAIKLISSAFDGRGAEANERLLREARAAAALDHPNAVAIFDVGEVDGAPYIVMELVPGRTLRETIGEAAVPIATRVAWLTAAARALTAAHKRGLVHRDVKPENVMVRDDGVVKVLDFGIARRSAGSVDPSAPTAGPALPTLTREGVKVGTPHYMAPEHIRGDALDGRADQFAWGALAYELLTGRLPWRGGGDPLATVASILTDEPAAAPLDAAGVPPKVRAVVLRALSKRPEDRLASMGEVVQVLEAIGKSDPSSARSDVTAGAAPRPRPAAAPPPATSATLARRYSTEEVREILTRAVDQQESRRSDARLGFEDLVAAAAEVGVDAAVLREASREIRLRDEAHHDRAADVAACDVWLRRKRRAFHRHLGAWVLFNFAMLVIGLMVGSFPWTMVPGLFWLIGLGMHAIMAYTASADDWEEVRERSRRREQWHKRGRKIERAIDDGVSLLLEAGAARQRRIDVGAAPARAGARIADTGSTASDETAEAEAIAAEIRAERRRR